MKVLLVDDHTLVRRGLSHLLVSCIPDAQVTEAGGIEEALEVLRSSPHDVALVDIRMPGRDGLELLREIRSGDPKLPVIMLSSYDNGEYVKAALGQGAAGYLLKDTTPDDLVQAIVVALSGAGNVLSPRAVRNLRTCWPIAVHDCSSWRRISSAPSTTSTPGVSLSSRYGSSAMSRRLLRTSRFG